MRHDPTMFTTSTSAADISGSTSTITYTDDGKPTTGAPGAPNPAPSVPGSASVNSPWAYLVSLVVCVVAVFATA